MPKAPSRKRVYKLGPRSVRTARVLSGMQTWLPCFNLFMNISLGVRPDVTQLTSRSILFPCNIIDRRHSELMCLFDSSSSKQCFFCLWITNHEYFLMKCQQAQQRWINQAAGNPPWENFYQNPFETTGQKQHRGNASSVNTKKRRGFSDHKRVQRQQQNTATTVQT